MRRGVALLLASGLLAGLAVVGAGSAPPARAEYATGGSGLYKGLIDWFSWGADGTPVTSGVTRTNTRTIAGSELATTCRISNIVGQVRNYRSGNWKGDALDDLYNIGGTGTANQLIAGLANTNQGSTVSFHFTCSITLDGEPVPLPGLVVADAESSNTTEYIQATPDQPATWRIVDRFRQGCDTATRATRSADNTLRLAPSGSECANLAEGGQGPMAIGFMEGATSAQIELKGQGRSAIALGVMLGADFGDAPRSYGQAGTLVPAAWNGGEVPLGTTAVSSGFALGTPGEPELRLGDLVDSEGDQLFSADATGDDVTISDDEDSLTPPDIHVTPGQEYTLPDVSCTGTGFVAGWLDWNRNGVFDAGEHSDTVPCASTVALTWTVPADTRDARGADRTFLRVRLAATADGVAEPVGFATSGEVEDYPVNVLLPRLSFEKTSDATADTRPGDVVTYTIKATNTETTDFTADHPANLVDDLTGVLDDATYGGDQQADRPGDLTYDEPRLSWTGPLAAGDTVTITYSVRIGDRDGDGLVRNVVWAPEDPGEPGETPDCVDGVDPATGRPCAEHEYPLPSLSVRKVASRPDLPGVGEQVTFTITVRNDGPGAYTDTAPATMADDLTDVLDDADIDADSVTASTGTTEYDAPELRWTGALAAGAEATISYTMTYHGGGDQEMVNTACVPVPETAPTKSSCASAQVPAALLTEWKQAETTDDPVVAGSAITYTLFFRNDGKADAQVNAVDDLTHVLDDADVTVEPASPDGLTVNRAGARTTIEGAVPPGATYTVTYTVTVRQDGERGDDVVANFLLAPDATPPPTPDCDPADPDLPDCTTTPVAGVTYSKSVSASTDPVAEGTVLTYTVTVRSTGTATAAVAVDDDVSGVLDDATFTSGPDSDTGSVTATGPADGVIAIRGTLAGGQTATVTYTVTVNGTDERGDNRADNFLVTPGEDPPAECVPDDPACTTTPLPNVSVTKAVDPASGTAVVAGDLLTYTLTFVNNGTAPGPVDRTDLLAGVFDDAGLTSGPDVSDPALTATADDTSIRVTGTLGGGQTVEVTYTVTVRPDGERGDSQLGNFVVPTGEVPPDECVPDSQTCTENPVPYVTDGKSVSPASGTPVVAGQELTYTLTFRNEGRAPGTVDRVDDLTHVLDDATVVREPESSSEDLTATRDGVRLSVTGTLAPGAEATVTYTVRVLPGDQRGDDVLANFLIDPDDPAPPGPDCADGDDHCTRNPVGDIRPAKSVDPASGTAVGEGDVLTYTLMFHNTGKGVAAVDYTDHVGGVLDDADLTSGPTASFGLFVTGPADGLLRVTGSVAPGETATVTYTVTVRAPENRGDGVLGNFVTTTGDDPPGSCVATDPLCTRNPTTAPPPEPSYPEERPSYPELPDTGTSMTGLMSLGLFAVLAGAWLVVVSRRRAS